MYQEARCPFAGPMAHNRDRVLRDFGRRLAQLRHEAGLTQEEVAERSGRHANYIGDIERGQRNPSLMVLLAIAGALDVSLSELLDGVK